MAFSAGGAQPGLQVTRSAPTSEDLGPSGDREPADAGYVAILVAIAMPLFIVLAALAVNVANWYAQAQRVQQAADAAALAGSVYLPLAPAEATASALDSPAATAMPPPTEPSSPRPRWSTSPPGCA